MRDGVIRRGNTWSYVLRVTDANGVSKPRWTGGFPTEAAAKAARDQARVANARGEFVLRNGVTVGEYLRAWLDGHALEVKPRTRAGYAQIINSYVVPRIGHLRLQDVRPATLSGLYRTLLDEGGKGGRPLSPRTVEYTHAVLRKAFRDAVVTDQVIPTNPAERAKRPRKVSAPPNDDMWNANDLAAFLVTASEHRLHAFYRLAAYTGARRGELLHLRWRDVDLGPAPSIRIRGTVGVVDGRRVEGSTKGGRERTVSIDEGTVAVLREHRRRQEADRALAGDSWIAGDLVFRMDIGAPLFPDTPTALFAKLIRRHNDAHPDAPLPPLRLHDLRHLHATLLLRAGQPVHVVSARLGHADPSITLRVYAHVLADQAAGAADAFAQAMGE
nr:site-specific integrase [Arsenicicoccus dermatophilus]